MRRVLVTGSRDWTDRQMVANALHEQRMLDPDQRIIVVHGNARGLDALAAWWANATGNIAEAYPADWSLGMSAGHIRNQKMVNLGADVCLAFPRPGSKGTWDCMRRAEAAGISVIVHTVENFIALDVLRSIGTLQPAEPKEPTLF